MRFIALLPLLCTIAAFILSMLCIFAGSSPGFMENFDLMTLNTSMLGELSLNTTSTGNSGGVLGNLEGEISQIEGEIRGNASNSLSSAINDVAKVLNIHDFYSVHILDYCEGYYEPDALANNTVEPWKNITRCSSHTALFNFNATEVLQSELDPQVKLSDLKWPQQVEDAIEAIEIASRAMFVLYCIGVGFAGLAIVGAVIAFLTDGRLSAFCNFLFDFLAFLALGIASAIATAIIVKVVDAVNQYGSVIGVAAYKGNSFLIFTWIATALMLVASFGWLVDCCVGRRRKKVSYARGEKGGRM